MGSAVGSSELAASRKARKPGGESCAPPASPGHMAFGKRTLRTFLVGMAAVAALVLLPATARGGVYVVAQCSPGITANAADAVFTHDSTHYVGSLACGDSTFKGVQIVHQGPQTAGGRYGRWSWTAPTGTALTAASFSYN